MWLTDIIDRHATVLTKPVQSLTALVATTKLARVQAHTCAGSLARCQDLLDAIYLHRLEPLATPRAALWLYVSAAPDLCAT